MSANCTPFKFFPMVQYSGSQIARIHSVAPYRRQVPFGGVARRWEACRWGPPGMDEKVLFEVRSMATTRWLAPLLVLVCLVYSVIAADAVIDAQRDPVSVDRVIGKGVDFLQRVQREDGSFAPELGPGITSLATTALLRSGLSEDDPVVAHGLQYIESFIRDDGGIYREGSLYRNYETSLAILCFSEVKAPRFAEHVRRAEKFIKSIQWEGEFSSPAHGGAGYGKHKRPDLSNTSFLVEALKAAGLDENDEAMQRALIFVSRCQNLETQYNTLPHANKVGDGGFYYTGAAGGSSQAGQTENEGLRSYGSMTYAGLKSLIYAGLKKDDPRVKAATEWIAKNYDLTKNPGMPQPHDGLYYYYHTFGKCLHALDVDTIQDARGVEHDWRSELFATLAEAQQENGSWVNQSDRWLEGEAELVTSYALIALSYCH